MNPRVSSTIHRTSLVAAGVAAVLSPVPFADELALLPIFGVMTRAIGRAHGLSAATIPWAPVARTATTALLARATVNLAVAFVPGVAAVANAASAAALTEWLGRYVDGACADPSAARAVRWNDLVEALRPRRAAA